MCSTFILGRKASNSMQKACFTRPKVSRRKASVSWRKAKPQPLEENPQPLGKIPLRLGQKLQALIRLSLSAVLWNFPRASKRSTGHSEAADSTHKIKPQRRAMKHSTGLARLWLGGGRTLAGMIMSWGLARLWLGGGRILAGMSMGTCHSVCDTTHHLNVPDPLVRMAKKVFKSTASKKLQTTLFSEIHTIIITS